MQIAMGYVYIYIYTYTRIYAYECAEWAIADKLHTRFREEEKKEKNTVLEILRRCFFFLFFFLDIFFRVTKVINLFLNESICLPPCML